MEYGSGWVGPGFSQKKNWKIDPKQSYTSTDVLGVLNLVYFVGIRYQRLIVIMI